jgi:hypothetical protein
VDPDPDLCGPKTCGSETLILRPTDKIPYGTFIPLFRDGTFVSVPTVMHAVY